MNIEKGPCSDLVWKSVATNETQPATQNCAMIWKSLDQYTDSEISKCIEWVVYSTKCHPNLNILAKVVTNLTIKFTVIGLHTKWRGFGGRINAIRKYLEHVPEDKIVIVTDAEDVIPLPNTPIKPLVDRFLKLETPTLFMSEFYCWPAPYLKAIYRYPETPTPYPYLNAGTYMGYRWAVTDVIREAYTADCADDQLAFTKLFLQDVGFVMQNGIRHTVNNETDFSNQRTPYIKLDWYNSVLQSFANVTLEDFDFTYYKVNSTILNTVTNGSPYIFHQNGDKSISSVLEDFLKLLGLQ